ncbi:hypothetical protein BIY22_12900 [Vibrio panuliri]|uniref:Acetyltransferase n=1 Tax=Vibrio panuliri TaxID=1381081 RepID=A0A1Q9HAJ1_9VIBR|nr:acyltransferase [Vibrio panuliri]OLQ86142.1 hypothetical protein BIY22_12900 [Vibrio panuliri]
MISFLKKKLFLQTFLFYSYTLNIMFFVLDLLPPFIRFFIFKFGLKSLGTKVLIDYKVFFRYMSKIHIGNNVSINRGCEIFTSANIGAYVILKDHVTLSPNVKIYSAGHDYNKLELPDSAGDIIINEHSWIGANSVILQNVTIGEGSIVSANSVVTKDVPPFSIVAGIPAKVIKKRVINV